MNEIPPNEVGRRVREIRLWRGLSLTAAAGLAGISFGYLGRIERGEQALTNRHTLEALAAALRVAPSEFSGRPWETNEGPSSEAHATLVAFEKALEVCELGEDSGVAARPWPQIADDLRRVAECRQAADYATQGSLVPPLLAELHGAYVHNPQRRRDILVGLITCYDAMAWATKRLGGRGLPLLAAKAVRECAEQLESPAWMGFAVWLRGSVGGEVSRERQYLRAVSMADRIRGHLDDSDVIQVYGMLHLNAALAAAVQADRATAETHLREAAQVARRMEEPVGAFGGFWFGEVNVAIWRSSIGLELGDGARAVETASDVPVAAIPSPVRQANYFAEAGRALLIEPRHRQRGLALLLRAEKLAPQRVRCDFFVREAVAGQLRSARRDAHGRELRGLAWRLGIGPDHRG
ncbi:helix-turn-helix transcriptional regulator [Nocardia farcinica]|uniref:Predicted transcriptional regulator n=1 Tax=Nocardia farcinica TaxID=37329 RepID=A0A0H5P421_NOCFR|nr:helix-turn-helix transcriptional regulator [Nocardia farcinica]MBA4858821.1 helix-turn-helix transcriptional regulator [Nocardia farcinica]MBC9816815.1 helix-turn-helix transcriptional regulator [Nocardia farcinica]MBF6141121.1 helix-turn-helix transcriptional regulator [Nocardia farcinica]MBF6254734.1 helix-turn-helix transcriptional regulator [Nocardia farcinica]MBF6264490.1 helix-turn-helix transcriptional regulator [Nocardia farcinica]